MGVSKSIVTLLLRSKGVCRRFATLFSPLLKRSIGGRHRICTPSRLLLKCVASCVASSQLLTLLLCTLCPKLRFYSSSLPFLLLFTVDPPVISTHRFTVYHFALYHIRSSSFYSLPPLPKYCNTRTFNRVPYLPSLSF